MNATIPMLLVSTVAAALASRSTAQEPSRPEASSRRPVDVSVEGLGEASRRAPGDTTRGGSVGFSARRPTESTLPLDCIARVADQATGGCLTASSTPTLGALFPYPGVGNSFVPPALVGGGQGNHASGAWSTVGGGHYNSASGVRATVGGGHYNSVQARRGTVGGGLRNAVSADGGTIGGGSNNSVTADYGTVGGGASNLAVGPSATIAGGLMNVAQGGGAAIGGGALNTASGLAATIGGGDLNTAGGDYATVAGGHRDSASGAYAAVGGGLRNSADGDHSVVPGGDRNNADGDSSFAAGRRAKANHAGSFVWGDSFADPLTPSLKTSSAVDEFNVYASGGVRMFTNSAATTGVLLAAGGSTWTMVSDRDAKENVEPVDAQAILDKVAELPVATWNYKAQDDSVRHMGPMAQDFYAAFGLGLGEKTIDTIDPNGVALAAIQGLNELVQENEQRLAEKDAEIEELRAANEALVARMERLEGLAQAALAR